MAATSTNIVRGDMGAFYVSLDTFTCDASYPTGGYTLPGSIPLATVLGMLQAGALTAGQGYEPSYNYTTGKLQVFVSAAVTPTASATVTVAGSATTTSAVLSMFPATGNVGVLGTTAAQAAQVIPGATFGIAVGVGTVAKAALAEVTVGTSLAGVAFNMLSIGY